MVNQTKKTIILLTGRKGSGKSWLSNQLFSKLSPSPTQQNNRILSIAGALKEICAQIYGHKEYFYNPELKELKHPNSKRTAREIMQHIGTEGFRYLDEDVWVSSCIREAVKLLEGNLVQVGNGAAVMEKSFSNVIIDDLRFENELTEFKKLEQEKGYRVICVKVYNPDLPKQTDTHASEAGIPDRLCDFIFINRPHYKENAMELKILIDKLASYQTDGKDR